MRDARALPERDDERKGFRLLQFPEAMLEGDSVLSFREWTPLVYVEVLAREFRNHSMRTLGSYPRAGLASRALSIR